MVILKDNHKIQNSTIHFAYGCYTELPFEPYGISSRLTILSFIINRYRPCDKISSYSTLLFNDSSHIVSTAGPIQLLTATSLLLQREINDVKNNLINLCIQRIICSNKKTAIDQSNKTFSYLLQVWPNEKACLKNSLSEIVKHTEIVTHGFTDNIM